MDVQLGRQYRSLAWWATCEASDWQTSFDAAVMNPIDAFAGRGQSSLGGAEARRILEIAVAIGDTARL